MPRFAYVNGRYVRHADAAVHIEDRGYQFADGVYEVCEIRDGLLIDERRHIDRLERSLAELRIPKPMSRAALGVVMREVVRRNHVVDGLVYLQVTRGVAPRNHPFPADGTLPALVITARSVAREAAEHHAEEGVAAIALPDNRWDRVDIKTVSLLPNVLAKQAAREAGVYEAWFYDRDGNVTEGSSTNAWIVTADGVLVTRPAEHGILRGITRTVLLDVAAKLGVKVEERKFSLEEAKAAREAFISGATTIVTPIVKIDDRVIGNGAPGSVAMALRHAFHDLAERSPRWSHG